MEQIETPQKYLSQIIIFTLSILLILLALYFSISVFLASLIGIGIGVLIAPILTYFKQKFSIPRALSAIIFIVIVILLTTSILYGVWYLVSDQIRGLIERSPEIASNLNDKLENFLNFNPWLAKRLEGLSVISMAEELTSRLFKGLRMDIEAVIGVVFAMVIAMYSAISLPEYFASTVRMFPASYRFRASKVMQKCAKTLRLWFSAQIIDMAILGLITTVALWAVGVEYWAVYGAMTGFFTIIPYIGILLVVTCATLITLASEPSMVIWVLAVFAITQQIEANVILPLIMKSHVDLPEVPFIIFILFLGVWFGLLGFFLAPPLFSVLRVLYLEFYIPKMNKL
jgi:predicted PurR-regulated permease PerM